MAIMRLIEAPAVAPAPPSNSINVISLAFIPGGMTIHFQTPFGLFGPPSVHWGTSPGDLCNTTIEYTTTYDRTPPCSLTMTTMCSQFFHNVLLQDLSPGTTYYYSIPGSNGTTPSPTLNFTTAPDANDEAGFSVAVLADMGYINARDTHNYLGKAVDAGIGFAWHGGDISYADNWGNGVLACDPSITWAVCYNGSDSMLFNTPPAKFTPDYDIPVPEGEIPNQGGPWGGDASPLYETNWDIWQQWMNSVTMRVPYMVLPGNHEASCSEGDGAGDGTNNTMTAYLNDGVANGTAEKSGLTYYSCPPSQRNFTAYQHRFRMPGPESGGVGNFWFSFDYGNAHFISLDAETDIPNSMENPFLRDLTGNETHPTANETTVTDSGPFGYINGSWQDNRSYQQLIWLEQDLASVNRTKTPWIFAMSHRPMYSSDVSESYYPYVRHAFEAVLLKYKVDAYFSGHVHWYERIWPMNNMSIVPTDVVDNNTYHTGTGRSLTTIVSGMAGNSESHSFIDANATLDYTAVLNQVDFGFGILAVHNRSVATWRFISAVDGSVNDTLTLLHEA